MRYGKKNREERERVKAQGQKSLMDAYNQECFETLNRLWRDNNQLKALKYFLDTAFLWAQRSVTQNPDVIILSPDVPEEIIIAAGARPYWFLGGSQASISWSDDLVPRDADPVSRSIMGFIHQPGRETFSNALFVVPFTNDNMRKIAYSLKSEGRDVFLLDTPPVRKDYRSIQKWQRQILDLAETVSARTKTRIKKDALIAARKKVGYARKLLLELINFAINYGGITPSAVVLIQNSYYYTDSLDQWSFNLAKLIVELKKKVRNDAGKLSRTRANVMALEKKNDPGVLLMGSPVYFPNYKIPFLIQDVGMEVMANIDTASIKLQQRDSRQMLKMNREEIIKAIAIERYDSNASPAFVSNEALNKKIEAIIEGNEVEGVVYHVLKGQIEHDFELEKLEKLFSKYDIPVFRLETDYQYQDLEQLRIRMEAFSEMLHQNRYREVKKAQ